jgi:carotenoid cleavage dioxygenase
MAMERRNFNQALVGAAIGTALGSRAATAPVEGDAFFTAFEAQRARNPWTQGYVGLQADAEPMPLTLRGRIPRALQGGAFYRNGPARHSLGGVRYHHVFDGDGMVQMYSLSGRGIVHQGKFVRTEKFLADSAAGRPVRVAFATNPPGAQPPTSADSINVANTSVVMHAGELLALWEGGSATRLDPRTLDTLGLKTWSPETAGKPFSAHPKVEPDGTLWNFGVTSSARGLLTNYRIKPTGELAQAVTVHVPDMGMVHDYAITQRHLVFLITPLVYDRAKAEAGATFLDSHAWKPELGLRVMVLPKDRLDAPQWFDLPTGFVFHLGNACEEGGVIRLDYMRTASAGNAQRGLVEVMKGREVEGVGSDVGLVEIDLKAGRARQTLLPHQSEMPRIDPRVTGRSYRQVYTTTRINPGDRPGWDAVMRLDVVSGNFDVYRYGADVMVEEHVFVPNRHGSGREGDGWLVGTALDIRRSAMLFSIFDAQRLADGPIAQGEMPRVMPLGLHAIFTAA